MKFLCLMALISFNLIAAENEWKEKESFVEKQKELSYSIDLKQCYREIGSKENSEGFSTELLKEKLNKCQYDRTVQNTLKLEKKQVALMKKSLKSRNRRGLASDEVNQDQESSQSVDPNLNNDGQENYENPYNETVEPVVPEEVQNPEPAYEN